MTLLFGKLTNGFVDFGRAAISAMRPGAGTAEQEALHQAADKFRQDASMDALYLVIIGIGMVFTTYAWMLIWTWTGETNAKRIRERYLKAILRQDIAYFDAVGPGEGT
jgi:ATP-binding cassette, subfamily B (MDR/TAP), member 1